MSQWQQQSRAPPAPASPWATETPAEPPASMADPYAGGDGSGSSSGSAFGSEQPQRAALPGRLSRTQTAALQELRADEVEFVRRAAVKMNIIRWSSFLIGGGLAFRFARRRNPPLSFVATAAATTMAGFGGVFAAMPLIVYTARSDLSRVKDPEHLKRVMKNAAQEVRAGRSGSSGQTAASSSSSDVPAGFVYEDQPAPGGNPMSDGFVQDGTAGGGKSRWQQLREGSAASASSAAAQPMGSRSSERAAPMQQPQSSLRRTGASSGTTSSPVELERERFRQEYERGVDKERRGLD